MSRRFRAGFVLSLLAVQSCLAAGRAEQALPSPPPSSAAIYDRDPNHLWNRLFVAFYRQSISNPDDIGGNQNRFETNWLGPDVPDPPLGQHPRFLLDDHPSEKANAVLDEFIALHGAAQIHDPLKRAVLQHDLWAVFDVLATANPHSFAVGDRSQPYSSSQQQHRVVLERKLAQVIHSLALTRAEIESLPDTYADAVRSGAFSDVLVSNRYNFLPGDLFTTNSGWIETAPKEPLIHTFLVSGRSVFRTFVKLPANDHETNPTDAKLPDGSQLLLLREMICLDENWRMTPTHLVESIQFRAGHFIDKRNFARELELNRALLFQGKQGGLRPVSKGDLRVGSYDGLGQLRVDQKGNGPGLVPFPRNCGGCHGDPLFRFSNVAAAFKPGRSVAIKSIAHWKEDQGKLDLLRKFIRSAASEEK